VLGLPTVVEGLVIVVGAVVLTVLLLLPTRKLIKPWVASEHNTVVGALFAAAGVVYAVVLAFVVLVVWEQWGTADKSVVAEAASMVAVYRAAEDLPQPAQKQAQDAVRAYARDFVNTEWSVHGTVGPHTGADSLNPVWAAFRSTKPTEQAETAAYQEGLSRLHELEYNEHLVHLAREGTLPDIFWLVLVAGGVVTVAFSFLLTMESTRVHAVASGALAAMLAALLFLIFVLNFPFTGPVRVGQQPVEHAILMFTQIDRR
jgi:hypothetical protein